jgi:hypothetical protein
MQYIHALILGVLEGITEFLPISSTGHLALGGALLGIPQISFMKSFEIIIPAAIDSLNEGIDVDEDYPTRVVDPLIEQYAHKISKLTKF